MNRPLLSRLTSCGTASYARGIQYRLSVRVSLLLRGLNNSGNIERIAIFPLQIDIALSVIGNVQYQQ
jgi:hypothetical protein